MTHPRPLHHLITAGKLYPNAWKQVEDFRRSRGKDGLPEWPGWCFLPMSGWYAIVSADAGVSSLDLHLVADVARLAAVGTWRYSQGIYRFAPELFQSLIDTDISGDLPAEVFYRLPEWCLYLETPGLEWVGFPLHGFWVHLEWDANTGRTELRFVMDTEKSLIGFPLHLGNWTVAEAVTRACNEASRQSMLRKSPALHSADTDAEITRQFMPLVSLVLYLCSDQPDLAGAKGNRPERPRPVRTRHGWRLFPADKPTVWSVGDTLARELAHARAHAAIGTGSAKAPHLRRAHWHGYWTGSGEQKRFSYKWLAPIFVGAKKENSDEGR